MNKIYVVNMYRWGDTENHSYFLGAFATEEIAKKAESDENFHRSNKYEGEIICTSVLNKDMDVENKKSYQDIFIKRLPMVFHDEKMTDAKRIKTLDIEDRLSSLERSRSIFYMVREPSYSETERRVTKLENINYLNGVK